jgi:sucrose-6-phosphate hydrolase SacC (GH32 family)
MKPTLILLAALLLALFGQAAEIQPLQDKTLVVWAAPANLTQRGGSVLTINDSKGPFDGIVFAERAPAIWMAGSENLTRTEKRQSDWPAETTGPDTAVQIAIVYRGDEVTAYRNGREYSRHTIAKPRSFDLENSVIVIGPRHLGNSDFFAGAVEDARIYDRALTSGQIAALRPNVEGEIKPWAWWSFDDAAAQDKTGRFGQTRLFGGAEVENGRLMLDGESGSFYAASRPGLLPAAGAKPKSADPQTVPEEMVLNYHLMHPGGVSAPADANAAFYLDGLYHLHYIIKHEWQGKDSVCFVHVTSPDMLHWTWQPTKLQPSFTGHGMFSGTGFITKEGRPAAIYHGKGTGRNQIAIARNNQLSEWEKPYPIEVKDAAGNMVDLPQGDPDLFLIGDTYYAIAARFGGTDNPPLIKSKDLKNWSHVGDFIKQFPPDVLIGEDNSCANFFPIGDPSAKLGTGKWMLLTISHLLGCRYYIGEWDAKAEQFVPEQHGRMNWRSEVDPIGEIWEDFFAPETVLTPDGRRIMWAWLANRYGKSVAIRGRSIQSLPRELSLPADGILRINPLRELESLRADPVVQENVSIANGAKPPFGTVVWQSLGRLPGDAAEIRITIPRDQAARKRFGFRLFGEGQTGGLPIILRPETGTIRVGTTEAPFAVADLPAGEDVELRIFVDKYLVEVFANGRQAVVASDMDWGGRLTLDGYSSGAPTTIKKLEIWKLQPTNQGFREAQKNRVWEPQTK